MNIELINKECKGLKVCHLQKTDSTNAVAREKARKGAEEGTLIIADRQTAGRGRFGREFFSYDGGIYMSLILRPNVSPTETLFITCAAAVAAAVTIENNLNKKALIKWVNDIYVDDKKVCGILTEGAINPETQSLDYAVLGVGINLFEPDNSFPPELTRAAALVSTKTEGLKEKIIGEFAKNFFLYYVNLKERRFMQEYASRSFLDGKEIVFERDGKTQTAEALKIDQNGALIVRLDGEEIALSSGDVQIKEFN